MPPEEVAEHVVQRLQQREPGDSIGILLLETLAEGLRIHRLHMEEQARQARLGEPNIQYHGQRQSNSRNLLENGVRRFLERRNQHDPIIQSSNARHDENPLHMMTGGAGSSEDHSPAGPSAKSSRSVRGRRSPPLDPPPTYRPRLGLTMGFGSHILDCIKYENERLAKEQRRGERRARGTLSERRTARKKTKARGEAKGSSAESEHQHGSSSGHRSASSLRPRNESSSMSQYPDSIKSQPVTYEETPHSHQVEDRERGEAGYVYQHSPHGCEVEDKNPSAGHDEPSWDFRNVPKEN